MSVHRSDRLDLVFQVDRQERVLSGPSVALGDHALVTAHSPHAVVIRPLDSGVVRIAPREPGHWGRLEPLDRECVLLAGFAVHLGRADRGETLHFRCVRVREDVRIAANPRPTGDWPTLAAHERQQQLRIFTIIAIVGAVAACMLITALAVVQGLSLAPVCTTAGPTQGGDPWYPEVEPSSEPDAALRKLLTEPFHDFIVQPNAAMAEAPQLNKPERWDHRFFDHTVRSAERHLGSWSFFERLDSVHVEYARALTDLAGKAVPEVWAGALFAKDGLAKPPDEVSFHMAEVAWSDPTVRRSGAAVQLALLAERVRAHNPPYEIRNSYLAWRGNLTAGAHYFYGDNIRCSSTLRGGGRARCGSELDARTQHFAYTAVAVHLLAVCYYAQSYGDDPVFSRYARYTGGGGYCTGMAVPTSVEIAVWRTR